MGDRVLQSFTFFFLLSIFLSSDPSIAVKPPLEAIHQSKKLEYEQLPVIFTPSISASTQLDTIPIINPTPPTTATPIILPASPPPPLITTLPPPTTTIPTMAPPPPTTTTTTTPTTSGGAWCVASPTASETALQVGLDYACGYGGADCSAIQAGQSCYNPNTIRNHASYAFNDYYQKNPVPTSCVFGGVAQLTYTDPSSGNCHYATPRATTSTPTPPTTIPSSPPPPSYSTTTPINPYTTPSVPTVYGSEPTSSPSSADSVSQNLMLLFTMACFSLLAANHL
ncbi:PLASMODESMATA CALLOSE-BINDING PROTEIN 2-like [Rhododendron vialii]|uniref:PLASMODESMATA CALLOSE-BINDING PROTEIN 2-like n=1 Tax=Rhododendron vialii TaxID=182163 RepID=UPI00265D8162|nr:PLASMODESMATA CALLOSE-BINDING PROTEIN 2-like [Rhododendron vialii]